MAREAAEAEENNLFMNEAFGSRQEEIRAKSQKIKQIFARYKDKKAEFQELNEEWETEKEDLLDTVRVLHREIKYKQLLLDNFIPVEFQDRIDNAAHWDSYV